MKVELQNPLPPTTGYPYVGIKENGLMVLFGGKNKGISLNGDSVFEAGEMRDDWMEATQFTPVQNEVIITNEVT